MTEESSNVENLSNVNENEQPNPPKKSRSVSDAERRRARRERKILNDAGSRLHRITATHSTSLNTLGETSSTLSSPFVSRKSSPQPSLKSSPTSIEPPENPFSPRRRNTGNLEPLTSTQSDASIATERTFPRVRVSSDADPPEWSGGPLPQNFSQEDNKSARPITQPRFSLPTSISPTIPTIPTTSDLLGEDEPNGYIDQDEHIRQFLNNLNAGNYQRRNSSTTSLASTIGGSECQYNPLLTAQDEYVQQDILQQQQQLQQIPFPFQQFFSPFGSANQQQNLDLQSKLWQVIHFVAMILLGRLIVWKESLREKGAWNRFYLLNYERPEDIIAAERIPSMGAFWYFITVELILQSSRIFFQQDRVFQSSTLVQFARKLPAPFSDVLTVLLRYNLIWNSLWEDICILVFTVGFTIMIAPFVSYFG
ncbi:unnamed protein product [Rhizophagus irregularis]|nr:unnamed protein product [Rhizophagus irregularis]CAB5385066.1 unnamed protein product [Rhizophagus irregularis]